MCHNIIQSLLKLSKRLSMLSRLSMEVLLSLLKLAMNKLQSTKLLLRIKFFSKLYKKLACSQKEVIWLVSLV